MEVQLLAVLPCLELYTGLFTEEISFARNARFVESRHRAAFDIGEMTNGSNAYKTHQ